MVKEKEKKGAAKFRRAAMLVALQMQTNYSRSRRPRR